jgi:hypothetical protein
LEAAAAVAATALEHTYHANAAFTGGGDADAGSVTQQTTVDAAVQRMLRVAVASTAAPPPPLLNAAVCVQLANSTPIQQEIPNEVEHRTNPQLSTKLLDGTDVHSHQQPTHRDHYHQNKSNVSKQVKYLDGSFDLRQHQASTVSMKAVLEIINGTSTGRIPSVPLQRQEGVLTAGTSPVVVATRPSSALSTAASLSFRSRALRQQPVQQQNKSLSTNGKIILDADAVIPTSDTTGRLGRNQPDTITNNRALAFNIGSSAADSVPFSFAALPSKRPKTAQNLTSRK